MRTVPPVRLSLPFSICAAFLGFAGIEPATVRAELSLVAQVGGQSFSIKEIRTGRLVGGAGNEQRFIDWNSDFSLAGDLVANAREVHWSPIYQIVLAPV